MGRTAVGTEGGARSVRPVETEGGAGNVRAVETEDGAGNVRAVETEDGSLSVRVAGDEGGPALVLLHGIPGSSSTWDAVVPRLAGAFRVVVPDLLGFGESARPEPVPWADRQAAAVERALDDLRIERALVAGHDWGGPVAVHLHARAAGHDQFFSVADGRRTAGLIPGADFRLLEDCGHYVPAERPDELVAAIRDVAERSAVAAG